MPRLRSPNRDKAFEIWRESGGAKPLKQIAVELSVTDSQIRKWKNIDSWDDKLKSNVTNPKGNVTKRVGAPKENQNAVGNQGGAPVGNENAVTHGFFRRIFPNDDETHAIVNEIGFKSPLNILWENIIIQYTAIARAQKIMFVQDQGDETKVLKRVKESEESSEHEWEYQHAWDKQANFLQAQSRAISTLEGLISHYEAMLSNGLKIEEQRLRLKKLKAEIVRMKGDDDETEDDGFLEALDGKVDDAWSDADES